ncbi:GAF domain-containing protein [Micropruina sonneratiae]|uniref:GAF domain-containing protein n=1 Tax=Micropruina sonneratiae TaxID=2986940 RepID=UPI002226FE81|nr:GAF domain-containing protein [Micropruina sp. KQZ13P-5]MCW3157423.1 GAF domain-containing protein [Micropruina sp. KQZ13P-5]
MSIPPFDIFGENLWHLFADQEELLLLVLPDAAGHPELAELLMVVTDADGIVLWRAGSRVVRRRADGVGFSDGALWTEQVVGTNAIGTALVEEAPVQLFSAEHYARTLHSWTCTADPVHDPRTGELLGVVNLSGDARTAHPQTVALVRTAVRLAQADLWRQREVSLAGLRAQSGLALDAAGRGGADRRRRVGGRHSGHRAAGQAGGARRRRPDGRAGAGRLHRRAGAGRLSAAQPWANGVSAGQLSQARFGDDQHHVSVRAEISRLRRSLGGVLLARPDRIAPNVTIEPTPPAEVLRRRGNTR